MAGDAGHRSGRLADRFATTATAHERLRLFQSEQFAVGDLGRPCRGLRADRSAALPVPDEPARLHEEPRFRALSDDDHLARKSFEFFLSDKIIYV